MVQQIALHPKIVKNTEMSVLVELPWPFLQSEHFAERRLWLAIANERVKRRPTRNSADSLVTRCSSLTIPRCDYETAVELINESKVSTFQRNIVVIQKTYFHNNDASIMIKFY